MKAVQERCFLYMLWKFSLKQYVIMTTGDRDLPACKQQTDKPFSM